jgi:hypothetical protein
MITRRFGTGRRVLGPGFPAWPAAGGGPGAAGVMPATAVRTSGRRNQGAAPVAGPGSGWAPRWPLLRPAGRMAG